MELIVISKEDLEVIVQTSVSKALADYFTRKEEKAKKGEFISVKDTARHLEVAELTVRNYISKGYIKAERIGRSIRIRRSELENALKEVKSLKYRR
jgi:excisionase family DNA binding protein